MEWETVIGLEVHVQLATQSKIFSGASTAFGSEANTQACAIDLAMPGTLPVLNENALQMAIKFGLAIDADINRQSFFERKNYFYPDLPKGYQTSQLEQPIVGAGHIEVQLPDGALKSIRIHHAHLEEDAGKSLHEDFHGSTGIDLNRAGTPLIEIVTEPDMRSAEEAVALLKKLHSIVTYLGISDGEMSQGSMRCDANVSVRLKGEEEYGTRAEIKNINSFRFVERAIKVEAERQIDLIEDGGKVVQETRLYDSDKNETRSMRSKEVANDYRYFPCPDLLPVVIEDSYIDSLASQLPELPDAKRTRFTEQYALSDYDADQLTAEREVADYFEAANKVADAPKLVTNWITGDIAATLNKNSLTFDQCAISAEELGGLVQRINDGTLSSKIAKQVFEAMWAGEGSADQVIEAKGLKQVSDEGELEKIVDQVLADKPQEVANYLQADEKKRKKMMGAFMGPIMQATKGQANPGAVNKILASKLAKME